jgi:hypothetical protein
MFYNIGPGQSTGPQWQISWTNLSEEGKTWAELATLRLSVVQFMHINRMD